MPFTEQQTLSALDDAGGALSSALMAARRLRDRMGYLASPEDRADIRDVIAAVERAQQHHYRARQETSEQTKENGR